MYSRELASDSIKVHPAAMLASGLMNGRLSDRRQRAIIAGSAGLMGGRGRTTAT